jgi:hypothetical protein
MHNGFLLPYCMHEEHYSSRCTTHHREYDHALRSTADV